MNLIAREEIEIVFQMEMVLEMVDVGVMQMLLGSLSSSKQRMEMEGERKERRFFEGEFGGKDEAIL